MSDKPDYEKAFKMLLAANYMGVYTDDWYMGDATESNEGVTKNGKAIA